MWLIYTFLIFGFIGFSIVNPYVRCFNFHILKSFFHIFVDTFYYFYDRKYNCADSTVGRMYAYVGLFGKGKTLSEVHRVSSLYHRYNDKKIRKNGRLVTQRVYVLSNIELHSIPYIPFTNLNQLVTLTNQINDDENEYKIIYVLIDELQNLLFCRNFKTNLSPDVLHCLTQIRKKHCSIFYTSTVFSQSDCTIRADTSYVIDCNKFWRLCGNYWYDAYDYDNALDVKEIKPVRKTCWFVRNADYSAYDTTALTDIIAKDIESGQVLPFEERNIDSDRRVPHHLSKKGLKNKKVKASGS